MVKANLSDLKLVSIDLYFCYLVNRTVWNQKVTNLSLSRGCPSSVPTVAEQGMELRDRLFRDRMGKLDGGYKLSRAPDVIQLDW